MFSTIELLKIAGGALIGALLAAGPIYLAGRSDGKAAAQIEAARAAIHRIELLEKNNAAFNRLSDRDRCLVFMRDSGLPDSACDERERVPADPVQ